jgi:putative copper resistance protein D
VNDPLIWVRAVHFAATMMVTGAVFFLGFVAEPAFRAANDGGRIAALVRSRVATIAWLGLAVALVSGAAWLVLQAQLMADLSLAEALSGGAVWIVLSETDFGSDWIARIVLAGLLAAVLCWPLPGGRAHSRAMHAAAIALAAGLAGTLAFAGHAAATPGIAGGIHLTADVLHLIAAAAWVGALVPLALLLRAVRTRHETASVGVARAAVLRFSTFGTVSVGTLVASGLVNSWMLVADMPALIGTAYGRLLLVKVALFLVMLSAAAVNRLLFTPRLAHAPIIGPVKDTVRALERNSLIEASLAAIIIVIVGLLGTMSPEL